MRTNAEQFAERGDAWNARNPQHHASPRLTRRRSAFHGGGREFVDEVEGYDEPTHGPRAAVRKPDWVDPPVVRNDDARRRHNERMKRLHAARAIGNAPCAG